MVKSKIAKIQTLAAQQQILGKYTKLELMYGLILLDYSMPGMDGVETAIAIRQALSELKQDLQEQGLLDSQTSEMLETQPYICCLTAYTGQNYKEAAMEAGMNDFINKPISSEQIID